MSTSLATLNPEAVVAIILAVISLVGAVTAGVRKGLADVKKNDADPGMRIAGGVIMDNQSMMRLTDAVRDLTGAVTRLTEWTIANTNETERLRDAIEEDRRK